MKVSRGLETGLIAAACAAPVFFGSVPEWAASLLSALLFFLLFLNPAAVFEVRRFPFFLKLAGAALFLWMGIQFFGITRNPYGAAAGFGMWLALAAAFLLVQGLDSEGLSHLAWAFVFIGLGESLYSAWQLVSGSAQVLWQEKSQYLGYATGTYINRNHLAGLLELCLGVHFGALMQAFQKRRMLRFTVLVFLWLIVFGVFLKTGSRAGLLSFAAACGFTFVWMIFLFKKRFAFFAVVLILFSAGVALWGGTAVDRFLHAKDIFWSSAGRFETWKGTLTMIRDNPWGVGLGGFELIFPRYQSALSLKGWGHAHQDYLELLAELGIPGFCAWAAFVTGVLVSFVKTLVSSGEEDLWPGWGILTALASLGIHSLLDFNFAIPANAFLALLLLAAAFRLSMKFLKPSCNFIPHKFISGMVRLAALLFFLISIPRAWAGLLFDQGQMALKKADFPQAVLKFQTAQRYNSWNPYGDYGLGISFFRWAEKTGDKALVAKAAGCFQEVTHRLPDYGKAWAYLALSSREISGKETIEAYFEKAREHDPGNAWITYQTGRSLLLQTDLSTAEKQKAKALIRTALERHYAEKPSPLLGFVLQDLWDQFSDPMLLQQITPEDLASYKKLLNFIDSRALWPQRESVFMTYWKLKSPQPASLPGETFQAQHPLPLEYSGTQWRGGRSLGGLLQGRAAAKLGLYLKPGPVSIAVTWRGFPQQGENGYAVVYLDGQPAGSLYGGGSSWQTRVLKTATPGGPQRLSVQLINGMPGNGKGRRGPLIELGEVRVHYA